MRTRVVLLPKQLENCPRLDYNYQHAMASALYQMLNGTDYEHLHDKKSYKFFSFSRLYLDSAKTFSDGIRIQGAGTFWFTTPDRGLLQALVSALEKADSLRIGDIEFRVVSVSEPYSYKNGRNEDTLITMSPVLLRKTIDQNGTPKQWEMSPEDDDFTKVLPERLRHKYTEYSGSDGGELEVVSLWDSKRKMIRVVDTWHRVHYMRLRMRGSPELLNFAYDCGLGEENSMGFGMVRSPFDGMPVVTIDHLMEAPR